MILLTPQNTIKFKNSTFDVGQSNNGGFRVDRCQFGAMLVPNFDIDGRVKESLGDNQT